MLIEYIAQSEGRGNLPLGRSAQLMMGDLILRPGMNDVNPIQWKKVTSNPTFARKIQAKVDEGIIFIRSEHDASQNLTEFDVPEAVKIIKETFDGELLEQWKDHDTRKGVLRAIDEQLKAITAAGTAGTEDDKK